MNAIRLGTRGSLLARAQSALVAEEITRRTGRAVETVLITTSGDKIVDRPLHEAGGKGLFVKEIEQALLAGTIDFAVHSCKDVPVTMPLVDQSGLVIAAIPPRLDPRDVLISTGAGTIGELPAGCVVGTGSLRRQCQVLHRRPDVKIQPIRGNIDTRIGKLKDGKYGATLLALAGLKRAGLFDAAFMHPISVEEILPAPGQGALALQCRAEDAETRGILRQLDDARSRLAVEAERAVVAALHCDCHSPIAVLGVVVGQVLHLRAALGERDGQPPVRFAAAEASVGNVELAVAAIAGELGGGSG
jgi:hydroxymethylbilane synthase